MTTVYYTSSFVPPELIRACGCRPQRLVGTFENNRLSQTEGMCAFAEAWLETLTSKAKKEHFAVVFATSCDQMRRAYDLYCRHSEQRAFLLNVPSMNTPNSAEYYRHELQRLQQFLCSVSGKPFDKEQLKATTSCLGQNGPSAIESLQIAITGEAVPLSIYHELNAVLEASGIGIALDITEDKLVDRFSEHNRIPAAQDPLTELADRYFQLPAIWKRPDNAFYRRFAEQLHKNNIGGVILFRYIFCDLWHGAASELKKRLNIPVLEIDLDGNARLSVSTLSRIQAFSEMLTV